MFAAPQHVAGATGYNKSIRDMLKGKKGRFRQNECVFKLYKYHS